MTSNDDSASSGRVIVLSAPEFATLFQVTKEFPNLPAERVVRLGVPAVDAAEIVQAARGIRKAGGRSAQIVVEVDSDDTGQPTITPEADGTVRASVGRRQLVNWRMLAADVLAWLDDRELFLRTGRQPNEVNVVLGRFVDSR